MLQATQVLTAGTTSTVVLIVRSLSAIVLVISLLSCSNVDTKKDLATPFYESATTEDKPTEPVPDFVSQALLAGSKKSKKSNVERFDVAVNEMPAKEFFTSLVQDADVNVVAHPELNGTVTLNLTNVSIRQVLNVTRDVYGYEYSKKSGIYTIYPRKLRTEIFPVNYIDIKRVGVTDTSVSIGEIESSGGGSGGSSGGGGSESSANLLNLLSKDGGGQSQGISPGSRVQTVNKTDFWGMLKTTLVGILGDKEGRAVMINPQAGVVMVRAMPSEITKIREFLEYSELSAKRQVVLEAQILEVSLSKGFEAGVNWNAISGQIVATKNVADGFAMGASGLPVNEFRSLTESILTGPSDNLRVVQVPGREAIGGTVAGVLQVSDITQLLSLLETQGKVQVLSSPRVSTVNNQKAVIRVGEDAFFVTGLSNDTTSSAGATTTSPEVELASFFSGISLDVTPQISEEGDVLLHIHPIISSVTDQQKEIEVAGQKISLPLALREIRESDSIVRAKSGQVVVLGGLMQESVRHLDGKRPGLGDIPGLNLLFKTKNKSTQKTELVILLRPVVVDNNVWEDQIDQFSEFSKGIGDYP